MPLPPRPAGRGEPPAPPAAAAAAAAGADEMPSWLIELQSEVAGEQPPGAAAAAPDWLAELAADDAAAAQPRPSPFGDAPWLDGDDSPPPPTEPQGPPAADQGEQPSTTSRIKMPVGATDWLRSIGQDEVRSEPLSEPISTPEDQSGVPDWLRDLTADEVARGIAAEPPDSQPRFDPQAPGWLADDLPAPDASTLAADWQGERRADEMPGDQVPSWLREAADEDEGRRAPGSPAELAGSVEMPAWLRDLGEERPAAAEPPGGDEPAWLRDAALRPPTDRLGGADEVEVPAWLRSDDEAPPLEPPPPGAAPAGDDEMPSWLREAPASSASSASPVPPAGATPRPVDDDEIPAWLRDPEPADGPFDAPPRAGADAMPAWLSEPPGDADDAPAWLRDDAGEQQRDQGIPAWLQDAPAPAGADEAPSGPTAERAPPPAWLEGESAPPPAPSGDDEVPGWLRDIEPPAPPSGGGPPAWLQDDDAPATPEQTWLRDAIDDGEAPPRPADEAPAWLREEPLAPPPQDDLPPWLRADEAAPEAPRPGAPSDPGLPSWLRGVADEPPAPGRAGPPQAPRRAVPSADPGESHSFLSGAELPSWLRVPEPERPADTGEGQTLDWLRRLGGPDQDEELQAAAVAAVGVPRRPEYRRSAEQLSAIGLLQQLSSAPYPEPAAPAAPAPKTRWQRLGLDRLLYALLALALILALLVPTLTGPFQTATPTAPGAAELGALLDGLGSEDVALVAYEWGAQRSGELRPLEEAVASRLIARRTKLILVSTDLQGTLLSFDLIGPLRDAGYNNENGVSFGGRDYVLLGYRPGGELALRSLAQDLRGELRSDFDGQDATQSLVANNTDGTPRFSGINDLSLILVLADQPQDVQAWMEQVRPAARDVPIVFLLPQEAQPLAQPFLRLPNVYHLSGQQGALALLASDTSSDPATVRAATGQLWFAVAAFLLLLAVGAVAALLTRDAAPREVQRER